MQTPLWPSVIGAHAHTNREKHKATTRNNKLYHHALLLFILPPEVSVSLRKSLYSIYRTYLWRLTNRTK